MRTEQVLDSKEQLAAHAASPSGTELAITGMTCGNCARHVVEAIQSVPGVSSAAIRLESNRASVRWAAGAEQDVPAIIHAVAEAGYGASLASPAESELSESMLGGWRLNLWVGVFGTAPIMLGDWVLGLGMTRWFQWCSFALAGAVQILAGARFYRGAWGQLKAGQSNMDTLVALGSTTAFAYSTWALFSGPGGHNYFMEAAAIITLISVGHWLESRASARASSALRQLLNLAPARARRLGSDGTESEISIVELRAGNLVVLRPGDQMPTDGEVVEGDSAVDESMLTGESAPVDKTAGSRLYSGTVNINGRLLMRVTATGEETALAHIIAAVQRAQSSRANIQRLGDRVSSVFVPIVVAVALAAGLFWGLAPDWAMQAHQSLAPFLWPAQVPDGPLAAACIVAAGILIIACPCAMGLATPIAIMAGSNAAAQRGILIRDGVALEKAGRVTAVVFDKTGTLTAGKLEVVKVWDRGEDQRPKTDGRNKPEGPKSEGDGTELGVASALASHSSHPISQVVARLSPNGLVLEDWREVRGAGVQAKIKLNGLSRIAHHQSPITDHPLDGTARLGSVLWLEESGVDLAPGKAFIADWASQGATVVALAIDNSLRALFAVKDILKPGAREAINDLERQGLKVYLVTGDNALTAGHIASQAGIVPANVFAQ